MHLNWIYFICQIVQGMTGTSQIRVLVKPRTEQNGMSRTNGMPGKKFTHHRVTVNVCVLTVCSTRIVPCRLQKSWMGSQDSCL